MTGPLEHSAGARTTSMHFTYTDFMSGLQGSLFTKKKIYKGLATTQQWEDATEIMKA